MGTPRSTCLAATVAGVLHLASQAEASLIAYELFDYSPGGLNSASGGSGFTGPWNSAPGMDVTAAGLTAPGALSTVGNALTLSQLGGGATSAQRFLSSPISGSSGEIWLSHIHHRVQEGFIAGGWVRLGTVLIGTSSTGHYALGSVDGSSHTDSSVYAANRGPDLLVARIRFTGTSSTIDLFLNPDTGPISPILSLTAPVFPATNQLRIDNNLTPVRIDEIRIGTTFLDVAIPAPASATLAGLSLLLACRRR